MSKTEDDHIWAQQFGLTCCLRCGIVKRADGKNKPCPGIVHVELRDTKPQGTKHMSKTERDRADAELYKLIRRWVARGLTKDEISMILAGGMFDVAADCYRARLKL